MTSHAAAAMVIALGAGNLERVEEIVDEVLRVNDPPESRE